MPNPLKTFAQRLRSWLTPRKPRELQKRSRLWIEQLEDRIVPSAVNEPPPSGAIYDLAGTAIPHVYTSYTTPVFTATSSSTNLSFAFREDPAFLFLDDVTMFDVTTSTPVSLVNAGFESGPVGASAPTGWTYLNTFGATFGGYVADFGAHSGSNSYYDGAVQAYDGITQAVSTTTGDSYTVSFWLNDNGPLTTFQQLSTNGDTTDPGGNGCDLLVYGGAIPTADNLTPGVVTATGGVEGTTPTTLTATFTDSNTSAPSSAFSGTINWGDTNTTAFTSADVTGSGGSYTVHGSHQYAEEGPYNISVTINGPGSSTTTDNGSTSVDDAQLSATGHNIAGVECLSTNTVTVATFTDLGGAESTSDYSAVINWGGAGTGSTTGTIVANGDGSFSVQGSFEYAEEGTYTVSVLITHENGVTANTSSTATIHDNIGILLLDPTGRGALNDTGNGSVTVTGCGAIVVDSNNLQAAAAVGNGIVTADEIDVTGNTVTHGNGAFVGTIDHDPPLADPFASLSAPPVPLTVRSTSTLNVTTSVTLLPGLYMGGIHISGQANVTLASGIYYLQGGGLRVSGQATLTDNGAGVLIYNAPANSGDVVAFTGQGDVHLTGLTATQLAGLGLSAPQYAGLQGMVIFQDRTSSAPLSVTGQGNVYITGTVYAADATVRVTGNGSLNLQGSSSKSLGSHLIADDLMVTGNGGVNVDASNNNLELI
jgi:hypothetical protein